ncbi:hypothetical protein JTB14_021399 [Gonioctena quinquepunctata]|nr:hypothetical protein JTB14_021399 [Gonioctena quinquepunctata]
MKPNQAFNIREVDFKDTFLRPCMCTTAENKLVERGYCYVEGTERDLNTSTNKEELTENVWYGIKPPQLFTKEISPLVAARKIYITRILLDGKRSATVDGGEEEKKEKVNVSIKNKKSAVRFLSQMNLE